jgi:hypothetical protein
MHAGAAVSEPDLCPRCGCCSTTWEECWRCGGEGGDDGEALMEEDPLWYGPDDWRDCDICHARGGFRLCLGDCDEAGQHAAKESANP